MVINLFFLNALTPTSATLAFMAAGFGTGKGFAAGLGVEPGAETAAFGLEDSTAGGALGLSSEAAGFDASGLFSGITVFGVSGFLAISEGWGAVGAAAVSGTGLWDADVLPVDDLNAGVEGFSDSAGDGATFSGPETDGGGVGSGSWGEGKDFSSTKFMPLVKRGRRIALRGLYQNSEGQ